VDYLGGFTFLSSLEQARCEDHIALAIPIDLFHPFTTKLHGTCEVAFSLACFCCQRIQLTDGTAGI